jgi:hypothetical protein
MALECALADEKSEFIAPLGFADDKCLKVDDRDKG